MNIELISNYTQQYKFFLRMNLTHSLKTILILQKIFCLCPVALGPNGPHITQTTLIFIIIFIVFFLSLYAFVAVLGFTKYNKIFTENPIDKGTFSSSVIGMPTSVMFIAIVAIYILALTQRKKELFFFKIIIKIDKKLSKILDLEKMYGTLWKKSLTFLLGLPCIVIAMILQSLAFQNYHNTFLLLCTFMFTFITLTYYANLVVFTTKVMLMNDYLKVIREASPKFKDCLSLLRITKTEKLIEMSINLMNETICVKQTLIILCCWFKIIAIFYMILLQLVFTNENSITFIAGGVFGVSIDIIIVAITTIYGEKLEINVSTNSFKQKL